MLRFARGLALVRSNLAATVAKAPATTSTSRFLFASSTQVSRALATQVNFSAKTDVAQFSTRRFFSVDADSDAQFKPQTKQSANPAESEAMQDMLRQIKEVVTNNNIVLFMKGTPDAPQCGFSGRVVKILSYLNISYESCNVLDDPLLREGIKIYSDWPTIPQLYVKGEFIGGSDIVTSMFTSGELHELLGVPKPAATPSTTTTASTTATAASASGSSNQ